MDRVSDEEVLYRCVRREYIMVEDGRLRLGSLAFTDPRFRPSVDRAKLRNHDPQRTQVDSTDGVVSLIAADIRNISDISQRTDRGDIVQRYAIDVEPAPLTENAAHAEVHGVPEFESRSAFKKLLLRLAEIARWELLPKSVD